MAGKLVLVSVPIGNIQDITLRGLQILQTAQLILAEDTRQIIQFAKLSNIVVPEVWSYREQVHSRVLPSILQRISAGETVALVTDRGTPAISDPGYLLVKDVLAAGYEVDAAPGVSAVIMALSLSGLPTSNFTFLGFLPKTSGKQQKILAQYLNIAGTLVIYESPFRVVKLLQMLQKVFSDDCQVVVAKELTKLHQTFYRGSASEVLNELGKKKLQGEFVVMVSIAPE